MASTYSTNLKLTLIGDGEQAGTWGQTTNTNLGTLLEQAISGYVSISFAAGDVALTMDDGVSCSARNMYLELTSATAARTLTVPGSSPNANKKLYFVYNNSGYAITVKVALQTGVTLPNGAKSILVCNGTDIVNAVNSLNNAFFVDASGNIYGTSGSTSMTNGFIYVPSASGNPTSTPTALSGRAPIYYDQLGNQLYVYNTTNSMWSNPFTVYMMRNRIINGSMDVSQRGTSFALTSSPNGTYTLDRWSVAFSGTVNLTITQDSSVPSSNEFNSSLKATVTVADTSIGSTDFAQIQQIIEGANVRDLIGQTFTISFWVKSSITGTYCIGLENAGVPATSPPDRSYISTYTINSADTWEYKTITISGGLITAGTWDWGYGAGLRVTFALSAGANYQTTANAWQTGNYIATPAQVNAVSSTSNVFALTGVQLEKGTVANSFEHRLTATELALCTRYYSYVSSIKMQGYVGGAGATSLGAVFFPAVMRTAPSLTFSSIGYSNCSGLAQDGFNSGMSATVYVTTVASGAFYATFAYAASAEIL